MLNPSMIIHQLGLLCVLNLDDRAALGEDGVRDSTWTDVRAPLGRLRVTMVDELVAEGHGGSGQGRWGWLPRPTPGANYNSNMN